MALVELQSSLFFAPNIQGTLVFEDLIVTIRKSLSSYVAFQSPATMIPVPDNAPAEIPRVQMLSFDGKVTINISRSAVTLTKNVIDLESTSEKVVFHESSKQILRGLISEGISFIRAGIVYRYVLSNEKPSKLIHDKYMHGNIPDDGLIETSINLVYRKRASSFPYNEITNISNSVVNQDKKSFFFMRDFNTAHDETVNVTPAVVDELIQIADSSMNNDEIIS
ncbi:hypothetical protein [Aeromonas veronii]|uniref:hypothetical protein n=1 Tax=Aeromonas veronii TaxID=654 RepID=UPI001F3BA33C|nr:hypothetical protein [Aeromonas veronii]MCF5840695.1 hypothetical protein [Aeromonas veronii]